MKASNLVSITSGRAMSLPIDTPKRSPDEVAELLRADSILQRRLSRLALDGKLTVELLTVLSRQHRRTAKGKGSETAKPAEWTQADAGQAAGGVQRHHWFALLYAFALDDSAFWLLRTELLLWAARRARTEHWPKTVRNTQGQDRTYMDELVMLALLDERRPSAFLHHNGESLRHMIVNVRNYTWRRRLLPIYDVVRGEYASWVRVAERIMDDRLSARGL
jgi:hypothetical protein